MGVTLKPELQGSAAKDFGKWARSVLEQGTPGLSKLVAEIQDEFKHTGGVLKAIDGGFIRCPSQHAALNYKLQSAGAIVMKKAAIIVRQQIKSKGLDGFYVGNIHDEGQLDVSKQDADEVGRICVESISEAGVALGFKVPLTGNFKTGANWSQCH